MFCVVRLIARRTKCHNSWKHIYVVGSTRECFSDHVIVLFSP